MTRLRFIIDDATQCKTQQAVLLAFAADLEKRAVGEVVRSSLLNELPRWLDVPAESSRRLGLYLLAFQPTPNLLTVFLPSHIVPGGIDSAFQWDAALTTREFSTIADLDFFTVNNAHRETYLFHDFVSSNQDYESVSRYDRFKVTTLPDELISGGLFSALQLTNRPWYSAFAPVRLQWLAWVKKAIDKDLLDFSAVEKDAQDGLVRPSLLSDVKALLNGACAPPLPDLTLDSIFVSPERRLDESQYRLLYSAELQKRAVEYAKRNARSKSKLSRRLFKLGYQLTYKVYSVSVRPLFVRMRKKSGGIK
jgi:hypothetical protein